MMRALRRAWITVQVKTVNDTVIVGGILKIEDDLHRYGLGLEQSWIKWLQW